MVAAAFDPRDQNTGAGSTADRIIGDRHCYSMWLFYAVAIPSPEFPHDRAAVH